MRSKVSSSRLLAVALLVSLLTSTCGPPSTLQPTRPPGTLVVFSFGKATAYRHLVAFVDGTFIDLQANSLGSIRDALLSAEGPGWFEHDTTSSGEEFRWAGGEERTAALTLQIPKGAEGMFLGIRSAIGGLEMKVKVGDDTPVTLILDSNWQTVYVPIGDPIHELAPDAEPIWSEGHYFPEFPPPSGPIYSFRIHTALEDWWGAPSKADWRINQDFNTMAALTLTSMQGIINRSGPRVYLDWVGDGPRQDASHYWVPVLQQYSDLHELPLEPRSAINFLWRRFGDRFSGVVVYDPEIADTINLATMISGLENRLILAPDQLNTPGMPVFDTASVKDLRTLAQQHHWDNTPGERLLLYKWAYDYLWNNPLNQAVNQLLVPQLERRIIGVISPGPQTTVINEQLYDPLSLAPRDYYIALRIPALWISPTQPDASDLFERFLQDAPAPIPVMSFFSIEEQGTVALASSHGDWTPVITVDNSPLSAGNLTVFSGVRPEEVTRYNAAISPDHIIATLGDKPVETIIFSDGDNIQYQLDHGFPGPSHLAWDEVKGLSFGWSINPILAEIAPAAWNDYVATANGTRFISALSGGGYAYPLLMDDQELDLYLRRTAHYLNLTGLRTTFVDNRTKLDDQIICVEIGEPLATQYYQRLKSAGLLGIVVPNMKFYNPLPVTYLRTSMPIVYPSYVLSAGNGQQIAQALSDSRPGEIVHDLSSNDGWLHGQEGQCWEGIDDNGATAIVFHSTDCSNVSGEVSSPLMTLTPGTYTATYHLKVPNSLSQGHVALLKVLELVQGAAQDLAHRWVDTSDFPNAGVYQDFSITFTLTKFVPTIHLWMDYTGGTTGSADSDLYLDTITLTRSGGSIFPVFAPVYVGQVSTEPPTNADLQAITTGYEADEVVVLSPDEFIAALNPEFMIEFAIPYLGERHRAIQAARAQLRTGQYFESLYTIREALKDAIQ
jgi:hypothetical protein